MSGLGKQIKYEWSGEADQVRSCGLGCTSAFAVPVEGGNRQWENPGFFGKVRRFWSLGEWDLSGGAGPWMGRRPR